MNLPNKFYLSMRNYKKQEIATEEANVNITYFNKLGFVPFDQLEPHVQKLIANNACVEFPNHKPELTLFLLQKLSEKITSFQKKHTITSSPSMRHCQEISFGEKKAYSLLAYVDSYILEILLREPQHVWLEESFQEIDDSASTASSWYGESDQDLFRGLNLVSFIISNSAIDIIIVCHALFYVFRTHKIGHGIQDLS